ncbi:MAG: MBL fold metallo-hydrolase [Anaerotruncus sp.]|nr:MBL fold metallo-hydrolase [Anaerotruncus sp.]
MRSSIHDPLATEETPELKRSRWEMLFGSPDMASAAIKPTPANWSNDTITAAWIGHATVLINFYGTRIITDPVFSERIGIDLMGFTTLGPKRLVAPALSIEELGPIDLILLSHAHMDHLDLPSLREFKRDIPVVVAKNTPDVLDGLGLKTVVEMDWGDVQHVLDLEIEALQVAAGWRFPWEVDRSRGNFNGPTTSTPTASRRMERRSCSEEIPRTRNSSRNSESAGPPSIWPSCRSARTIRGR